MADTSIISKLPFNDVYINTCSLMESYQEVSMLIVSFGSVQATTSAPKPGSARKLPAGRKNAEAASSKEAASKPAKAIKSGTSNQKHSSSAKEEKLAVRRKRKHEPVTFVDDDDECDDYDESDDDDFGVSAPLKDALLCIRRTTSLVDPSKLTRVQVNKACPLWCTNCTLHHCVGSNNDRSWYWLHAGVWHQTQGSAKAEGGH